MKNFKKLLLALLLFISVIALNPVQANAAWKNNSTGWWYTQGTSYATGWTQISGQWYYFDSDGYMKTGWLNDRGNWYYFYGEGIMAHDCYIGNYYLSSNGAWTNSVPTVTKTTNPGGSGVGTTKNKSQTVYITATGKKYHAIPKCGNTKSSRAATLEEAQRLGLGPCQKCY